jgi:drug/metabolite transporter (DMT)-like permease
MAVASGGAGRAAVLVFTMPFWTLLLAWPILHERIKGYQWLAVACALAGMVLVVEPWQWHGDIAPKLWAVMSGFGWAAGTIATKYFQRHRRFDALNFIAWQMLVGVLPLTLLPLVFDPPATQWSVNFVLLLLYVGAVSTALGFVLWIAVLRWLPAGTASLNMFAIPVIALLSSMAVFGERLTTNEWIGIGCIGAGLAIISIDAWASSRRGAAAMIEPTPLEGG